MTTHEAIVTTLSFFDFLLPWGDYSDYPSHDPKYTSDGLELVTTWNIYGNDGCGLVMTIWYLEDHDSDNCFAIIGLRPENRGVTYYSLFSLLKKFYSEEFQNGNFKKFQLKTET